MHYGCACLDFCSNTYDPHLFQHGVLACFWIFTIGCLSQYEWRWISSQYWNAMCTSSSVSGLSIIFPELFSILQFSKNLTKILRENVVNLVRKGVGYVWEGKSECVFSKLTRKGGKGLEVLFTCGFLLLKPWMSQVPETEDIEQMPSWLRSYSDLSIAPLEWTPSGKICSHNFIWLPKGP